MALEYLDGCSPEDLGMRGYKQYRNHPVTGDPIQLQAIEFAAYSDKRFVGLHAPPGIGKSLIGLSVGRVIGGRTLILTATKGLQDQYGKEPGVVDVRGKQNYSCQFKGDCRLGLLAGCSCAYPGGYKNAVGEAKGSPVVVTNYSYWITGGKGLGSFDLIVCDEAHALPDILADHVGVRLYSSELQWLAKIKDWPGETQEEWIGFAGRVVPVLDQLAARIHVARHEASLEELKRLHQLEELKKKLLAVCEMQEPVVERHETNNGFRWDFDVVWPGKYAEGSVFRGIPHVLLMSGTLTRKTLGLLGIKASDVDYQEWDRLFPAQRHPIYYTPPILDGREVRVDRKASEKELEAWVKHIDAVIEGRLDRKGLVQTVSYDRAKYLMERSRFRKYMVGNTNQPDSPKAAKVMEEFKKSKAPSILVSPSFTTGWDLPGEECEYIIICKVPFKPSHSKIQKAREAKDKEYGPYLAMTEIVQGACRGMRAEDDRCEVFAVDGHFGWFMGHYKHLAPRWFPKAFRKVSGVPDPPIKL